MKKIILALMLLTPFFFSSCEEAEELTGAMEFTIGDKSYSFPITTFLRKGEQTIITSTELTNSATIIFKGDTSGNYPLGVGANLEEALRNLIELKDPENIFIYYPTGNIDDSYISLYGSLVITEYTDKKITGTFVGFGVKKDIALSGVEDIITAENKAFAGAFTAIAVN